MLVVFGAQCRSHSEWPRSKRQSYVQTFNLTQSSVKSVKSSFDPIDFIMLPILWPLFLHLARSDFFLSVSLILIWVISFGGAFFIYFVSW